MYTCTHEHKPRVLPHGRCVPNIVCEYHELNLFFNAKVAIERQSWVSNRIRLTDAANANADDDGLVLAYTQDEECTKFACANIAVCAASFISPVCKSFSVCAHKAAEPNFIRKYVHACIRLVRGVYCCFYTCVFVSVHSVYMVRRTGSKYAQCSHPHQGIFIGCSYSYMHDIVKYIWLHFFPSRAFDRPSSIIHHCQHIQCVHIYDADAANQSIALMRNCQCMIYI